MIETLMIALGVVGFIVMAPVFIGVFLAILYGFLIVLENLMIFIEMEVRGIGRR